MVFLAMKQEIPSEPAVNIFMYYFKLELWIMP